MTQHLKLINDNPFIPLLSTFQSQHFHEISLRIKCLASNRKFHWILFGPKIHFKKNFTNHKNHEHKNVLKCFDQAVNLVHRDKDVQTINSDESIESRAFFYLSRIRNEVNERERKRERMAFAVTSFNRYGLVYIFVGFTHWDKNFSIRCERVKDRIPFGFLWMLINAKAKVSSTISCFVPLSVSVSACEWGFMFSIRKMRSVKTGRRRLWYVAWHGIVYTIVLRSLNILTN